MHYLVSAKRLGATLTSPNPQDITDILGISEYSDEWPRWYSLI